MQTAGGGKMLAVLNSRGASGPRAWLIQEKSNKVQGQKGRHRSDHAKPVGVILKFAHTNSLALIPSKGRS